MDKVYIFLADGFEEIEGLTVVDVLRRGGVQIETVSISDSKMVAGSHGINIEADRTFGDGDLTDGKMYILPGGMPGTIHLGEHAELGKLLMDAWQQGKYVAAICAAPSVLAGLGILEGRKATSNPGFMDKLTGAITLEDEVVKDGKLITSRGMGTAIPFALQLLEELEGVEKAREIAEKLVWKQNF